MKTVILCGGMGTRLSEETVLKPKPLVEVGGRPILWHILKQYAHFGYGDFILALGYKAELIKDYFLNYRLLNSDFKISLGSGHCDFHTPSRIEWEVDLIDTGLETMTGGRLKRLEKHLSQSGTFMLTYGDGVSSVDVAQLVQFHKSHGKLATVTAVHPTARFGGLGIEGERVKRFIEKPQGGEGWINGGFFVFEPEVFKYLENDETILERSPMERLTEDGQLMAYRHEGFWQCMDTIRDRQLLDDLWAKPSPPWKLWKD